MHFYHYNKTKKREIGVKGNMKNRLDELVNYDAQIAAVRSKLNDPEIPAELHLRIMVALCNLSGDDYLRRKQSCATTNPNANMKIQDFKHKTIQTISHAEHPGHSRTKIACKTSNSQDNTRL